MALALALAEAADTVAIMEAAARSTATMASCCAPLPVLGGCEGHMARLQHTASSTIITFLLSQLDRPSAHCSVNVRTRCKIFKFRD